MARKHKKSEVILHFSSYENTMHNKPRFNTYAIGHGVFKDKKKYDRKTVRQELRAIVNNL